MALLSIIIPSRNEKLLAKTVDDIYAKATGEIEVIVVIDGKTDYPLPKMRPNLTLIKKSKAEGLKVAINDAAEIAKGKYLMKTDAHCMFGEGFDEILQNDCKDNWVVIARRYTLNPALWEPKPGNSVDYYYLGCPWTNPDLFIMKNRHWKSKVKKMEHILIDDVMTIHGSMWFTTVNHFLNRIGGLDEESFGEFAGEAHEIPLKTWLGGGRVVINKKTWYAHVFMTHIKKKYPISMKALLKEYEDSTRYWTENKWEGRIHDFDWLIEKFWKLPNWPDNWRDYYEGKLK